MSGRRRSPIPVVGPLVVAVLAFLVAVFYGSAAIGQDDGDAVIMSDPIVATVLEEPSGEQSDDQAPLLIAEPSTGDVRFLDLAAAAFTRCMRANGIDFPELEVSPDGRLIRPPEMEDPDESTREAGRLCRNQLPDSG